MYYVIQVAMHEEDQVEGLMRRLLTKDVCQRCFHLRRHILKKYRGEWHDVHERLLPGYVFVETEDIVSVYATLRRIDNFTKLLGREEEEFIALTDKEVRWLECLLKYCGGGGYEIPLSKIMISNDNVEFISGPLKDMKPLIKKVNMHKRIADVHIELGGKVFSLYMGIEF